MVKKSCRDRAGKGSRRECSRRYDCAIARPTQDFRHAYATMEQPIPVMQTMQLLASGGVTMAAGAMISFSFALSPPLTVVPPVAERLDVNGNVTTQRHRSNET